MANERISRRMDDLGRIVLPINMCKELGWNERTTIDVVSDYANGTIILDKHLEVCSLCDEATEELIEFKGRHVCMKCIHVLNQE